jgi:hypothetical protein
MSGTLLSPALLTAVPVAPVTPPRPAPASAALAGLAAALAARTDLWEPRVVLRASSRWSALLDPADAAAVLDPSLHADLAAAQVWLLTWLPGQGTPLHDHGPSAGAFAVAQGALTERVVAAGRPGQRPNGTDTVLESGRVRFFGSHYVHRVRNESAAPAVSVHVYAPRLAVMNTYRADDDGLVRTGTERAGVDW